MDHITYLNSLLFDGESKQILIAEPRRSGKTTNTMIWARQKADEGFRIGIAVAGENTENFCRRIVGGDHPNICFLSERRPRSHFNNPPFDVIIYDESVRYLELHLSNPGVSFKSSITVCQLGSDAEIEAIMRSGGVLYIYPSYQKIVLRSRLS